MPDDIIEQGKNEKQFLSDPRIIKNHAILEECGVFEYIDSLNREVHSYKSLLTRGLDIFNRTSIDEILNATVRQIFDHFLPSFISFLWKPVQNRNDVTIKSYKNYMPVDINLRIDNITAFESFFLEYPRPINFDLLAYQIKDDEATKPFNETKPEIIVPILGPFGLYGIILIGRKIHASGYSSDELIYLQHLMSIVSQAIKNHLHYEHSLRDVKTGLYNHGFFMTRIIEEIARMKRNEYVSSIIYIDVDKFKDFNDTYGHLAGDCVLEHIALMIRQSVRKDDIPSRFGGEEFTVLLPQTDQETVWSVAERLRMSISEMQVTWDVPLPKVTISLGIYTFDSVANINASEVIARADQALYFSKESGRNRTTIWNHELFKYNPEADISAKNNRAPIMSFDSVGGDEI